MKKLSSKVLMTISAVATIAAAAVATSACFWCAYQPEEPKCLEEE